MVHTGIDVDSLSVSEMWGSLQPQFNENINAIEIKFRNTNVGQVEPDSVFKVGVRELTDSSCGYMQNTNVKVKFIPLEATGVTGYKWTINANIITTVAEPEYTFDTTEINNFPVYLHTFFENGCIGSTKRCLDFRNSGCEAEFDFHHDTDMTYQFYLPAGMENEVEKVVWYVNGNVFDSKSLSYTFPSTGNHFVNADVFYKDGCAACVGKKLQVDPNGSSLTCNNNFKMEFTPIDKDAHLQLGQIEINYWDDNGVLYSTKYTSIQESINITHVSDYENNHQGQSTKLIELDGDFTLVNASGQSIEINNFKGALGVAY